MSRARFQVLLVGMGGQGVLAAAQILGLAAHAEGSPVVVGQLHGMSQRGGSVRCTAIFGEAESSHLVGDPVDAVVGFEALETLRAAPEMGPSTRVVMNREVMPPFQTVLDASEVPDSASVTATLRGIAGQVHVVDAPALVGTVGEGRTLNVLMLGAAAGLGLLPVSEPALLSAIKSRCGRKFAAVNEKAFLLGVNAVQAEREKPEEARV